MVLPSLVPWILVAGVWRRAWWVSECLDVDTPARGARHTDILDHTRITVLIPARNEAQTITTTLAALVAEDHRLNVIVVDDQSTDGTAARAREAALKNLTVITGQPLPAGWNGKLWALEQGRQRIDTDYILLLDADITLPPGMLDRLAEKLITERLDLVSLMVRLRMQCFWGNVLLPAFIYFFRLLYPFHLSNQVTDGRRFWQVAAAAGGCMLLRRNALERIGGFHAVKGELIDDCALARAIKTNGGHTWIGLTHSVHSHRRYDSLSSVWEMVARTAYTQLRHSPWLLLLCSLIMVVMFVLPVIGILLPGGAAKVLAFVTLLTLSSTYLPIVRFYHKHPLWSVTLPLAGSLFLLMTWTSAVRHIAGAGVLWKARQYS